MAVMARMRENTKTILIILVVAFLATIVFSWGMGGLKCGSDVQLQEGVLATVNGQKITREQFDTALENELAAYRQRSDADLEDYQIESIRNRMWDLLIENELLAGEIARLGLAATNEEIKYYIFEQPPDFIREQELFKNEQGAFDETKYQSALNDPRFDEYWVNVEQAMRVFLPRQKLEEAIRASVRVTDEEVKRDFCEQNERIKIRYVYFDPSKSDQGTPEISEEELRAYYKEHSEDYVEPEKRKIDYVFFSTEATADDTAEVRGLAQELLQRAREGEDFAELAEIYSEDPGSADNGGDLGFFDKDAMLQPFSEAAFAAQVGSIVGPVETIHGLHIIKVEDRKVEDGKPKVKARHILLKFGPTRTTIENAQYAARYFADQVREGDDFYELAEAETLKVLHTDFFPAGGFIPNIGRDPQASRFIFTAREGTVSNAIKIDKGYVVFAVAGIQKEQTRPFEDVESQIRSTLTREKNKDISRQMCEQTHEKILAGTSLDQVAAEDTLEVKESDWVTMNGYIPGVGRDPLFMGAASGLEIGEVSAPVEGQRGYYLIELLDKEEPDMAEYEEQKVALKNQLLQRKRTRAFQDWLANLKKQAKIEDLRGYYGY